MTNKKSTSKDLLLIETDSIDDIDTSEYKKMSEESRKNKDQTFRHSVAIILVIVYSLLELTLLALGSTGKDISFFNNNIGSFRVMVSLVIGYYFAKK